LLSLFLLCLGALPLAGAQAATRPTQVQEVRLWAGPDGTRVVLDLSGAVRHEMSTLRNPDRLVIDLKNAALRSDKLKPPAGDGLVSAVRLAHRGRDLRLVLDLSRAVQAKSFLTEPSAPYGYRLVIDLGNPQAAAATPTPVRAAHAPSGAPRDLVIAVDAGHGGEDPGASGRDGTREKDVTLAVARLLAERINSEPGMRAVLIRNGDYFVPLRTRIRKARAAQADLFVSVHADAVPDRSVSGSSVYVLSTRGASDEASRWLADRENAADLVGGVSLDDKDNVLASVLLDLSQSAAITASLSAAAKVLGELDRIGEIRKRKVQQAGFVVLKSPDIPSMLIETAYITNPAEERRLRDPRHQGRLAEAILSGVRNYFYENPPPGTRVAQLAALRVASN
jgi:N-acetylmuramoyl-L-alanine amidase